jgi:hypothetical protein
MEGDVVFERYPVLSVVGSLCGAAFLGAVALAFPGTEVFLGLLVGSVGCGIAAGIGLVELLALARPDDDIGPSVRAETGRSLSSEGPQLLAPSVDQVQVTHRFTDRLLDEASELRSGRGRGC